MSKSPLTNASPEQPFADLIVLDISQGVAGPHCAQILREQGARVIKVEPPQGDWARVKGREIEGTTAIFASVNAGKESVVVNARTPEGLDTLRKLADSADVIVESFRPGVAQRLGLDYEDLASRNPALVFVSINGFGSVGPLAKAATVDPVVQASGGLAYANRDAQGTPRMIGTFVGDLTAGTYAAQQAAAALYGVAVTGKGRRVESTLQQAAVSLVSHLVIDDAMFGEPDTVVLDAPVGVYETQNGHIFGGIQDNLMFRRLCETFGFDDWLEDEELVHPPGRGNRAAELNDRVAKVIATATTEHWEQVFAEADLLVSKIYPPHEISEHPQAEAAALFGTVEYVDQALPWRRLPGSPDGAQMPGAVPKLGEHTDAVLSEVLGAASVS